MVAAWLAVSVAAHAGLLLAIPGFSTRPPARPELTVTIERTEPPRPNPERPRERPPAPRASAQPEKRVSPARAPEPAPQAPQPKMLALPQRQPSPEPPAFTVPAPEAEPALEARREAAAKPARQAEPAPPAKPEAPRASAAYAVKPEVRYPRTAERGRVTLKVLVSRNGRAANVTLETSSGYPNLDRHAMQAVRTWEFVPARVGAEPVEQSITVNVDY